VLRFSTSACSSAAGRVGAAAGASAASAGVPVPRACKACHFNCKSIRGCGMQESKLGTQGAGSPPLGRPRAPAPGHPLTQDAETAVRATAILLTMFGSSGEAWQRTMERLEPGLAPRREPGRALSADGACADALMMLLRVRGQLRGARRPERWMVRLQLERPPLGALWRRWHSRARPGLPWAGPG